jgi:hypothetical protein
MNTMKKYIGIASLLLSILNISCIDRDTIAGTGKEMPYSIMSAGGNLQSGTIRTQLPIPLRVRVLAENGRPVRGVVVEFSNPLGLVSFSDTTAATDGDGYASTTVKLGTVADSIIVNATVFGLKGSPVQFSLLARAASQATAEKYGGDTQTGIVAGPLNSPLRIKVLDAYNNPVLNATAIFETVNGKCTPAVVQTDSFGLASSVWTLDTLIGVKSAKVTFPSMPLTTLNFTATARAHVPFTMTSLSGDTIHAMEGGTLPGGLRVRLRDKYTNPASGQLVRFSVHKGSPQIDTTKDYRTGTDGVAVGPVALSFGDPVVQIVAYSQHYPLPTVPFTIIQYIYSQIDSLRSSGGTVELFWEKNLNANFVNYSLERCLNFNFDQTTVIVQTITDENIISTVDPSPPAGTSPFYRIKMNYKNNFSFYTNIRQITVQP